jgi:hypothetical protein
MGNKEIYRDLCEKQKLEKEKIRLLTEKIKMEEEEKKKIRLQKEKEFSENEAKLKLEKEMVIKIKGQLMKDKITGYIKDNNWYGIIEELNEILFDGYANRNIKNEYSNYNKMNKLIAEEITNEISNIGCCGRLCKISINSDCGLFIEDCDFHERAYYRIGYIALITLSRTLKEWSGVKIGPFNIYGDSLYIINDYICQIMERRNLIGYVY